MHYDERILFLFHNACKQSCIVRRQHTPTTPVLKIETGQKIPVPISENRPVLRVSS